MHKSQNLRSSLLYVTHMHPEIKQLVKDTITATVISHPDIMETSTDLHEMLIYPFCEGFLLYFVPLIWRQKGKRKGFNGSTNDAGFCLFWFGLNYEESYKIRHSNKV